MPRLIDADELLEHVWRDRLDSRERIADLVKFMPTIEERKKGKWIEIAPEEGHDLYKVKCDRCGWYDFFETNYCGNCGAEMRGAEKREE